MVGSRIIGSVRAYEENNTCKVGKLIVHPDYENKGIATRLMSELEARFQHCKRYELYTGFKSERNLYLYDKLGYRKFKTIEVHDHLSFVYLEKYSRNT